MENSLKNKKIVVVEDDKFLGDMLVKKLRNSEAEVTFVNNGEEAYEKIKEAKPDIIVEDVLLPGITGFEVIEKVKKDSELKDIPVIFLSNMQSNEDLKRGQDLGAASFLIKSMVTMDEIMAEIIKIAKLQ